MTGNEIRAKYLHFFESKGHKILPSASLIPHNDPSILWTAAGMVPFKPYFTGAAKPDVLRATTCQKCLRTPDIEEVGKTARHHTFFEMLGNFSFGDYFKQDAIPWAWEFVTEHLGLEPEKLWITIYLDDDEAFEIWHKDVGVPKERIVRMGKDTNFWEIGVGPCGPCSEIYYDLGPERGCDLPDCAVGCDCDRYLEIWNLVFIQFFRDEEGNYTPLKSKGIDTGMGLERVASVLQKVHSNFDTDLLRDIMDFTGNLTGKPYGSGSDIDLALKVIADHSRAVTFAVSDGALPSNEGRGYVLRRLLRRAVRFGRVLGMEEPFLYQVAGAVIEKMGAAYPELVKNSELVTKVIKTEEERFGETLAQGTEILNKLIGEAKEAGQNYIDGEKAFRLYDTYGFPIELTQEIAEENNLTVDEEGFARAMEQQRDRARNARQETEYLSEKAAQLKSILEQVGETVFTGYDTLAGRSKIKAVFSGGRQVEQAAAGEEVEIILDITPCYAESGGQMSDHAIISGIDAQVGVDEVTRPVQGIHLHKGKVNSGVVRVNDEVDIQVDRRRRMSIARNHSATHLLHKALKEVLGEHVNQAGSLVAPDRLRFDFTHFASIEPEELQRIEEIVNNAVLNNLKVEVVETSLDEAREMGAMALFEEKYGDHVRVVKMGDFSLELCGGTHVAATSEVGLFKLLGESSVGSGLRRVEAVTGEGAMDYMRAKEDQLQLIAKSVKAPLHEVVHKVEAIVQDLRDLEKETETLRARLARYEVQGILDRAREIAGVKVLASRSDAADMDSLRAMVDLLRDKMGSGVIVLGAAVNGKVNLVAGVSKDLVSRGLHAGKLIKEIAPLVGGGGGGRPDMAQAGGKDPSGLEGALDKVYSLVEAQAG
ncbi:alanyl-tRNA synthetase [Desulfotomaculum arcticum]|uniref:Alanine--tRNA ligase n=1 Tax=Desulfotruncus arcticus DSM 17038 TaxID=1121424 RepID=A0A1I2ZDQ0_9FIRM|nr:alanine--tRNA ligase [Desulfotruncus arcticus]SFH35830.1 alanyl-tRNA synthetase [Desulfotomaculum arcticum] [Desulfotruncus arcticus DSM 17038]